MIDESLDAVGSRGMSANTEIAITDNLDDLLAVLPARVSTALRSIIAGRGDLSLIELVLDLGRRPEARFQQGAEYLTNDEVTREDLAQVAQRIGRFGDDNRAGIERTLHRISAIRNRTGDIVGLTCRVGRAVYGTIGIISDLVESGESILLLGRPGVGKCVTGDSLVLTSNGLQQLSDLVPDGLDEDCFAPTDVVVHGMNGPEAASHVYNGGRSATRRIVTRQGFALEGTPEHPVLALAETGELLFRRLDQLQPGDYVAIQRGQQLFGNETRLPTFEFTPRTNALDGRVPSELTEELGRFLGYLIAEGTLSFDNQVTFSHTDPAIQADMTALTETLFGLRLRPHLHHGVWDGKDFRVFGVKLRRFLTHLGLTQGRAADKRIPPCILTAPKPIVTAFLQALFEGDGSIYGPHGRIEIASASRALLSQLHVLLLNYGIVGGLRAKHNATYDRDYYTLTLIGENVVRFANEIGFRSTTKQSKLAGFVAAIQEAGHNPNLDVIPHQNERLRELRACVGSSAGALGRYTRSDNRAPNYHTLEHILSETRTAVAEPLYRELQAIAQSRFFFDQVKSIEEGEAYVYDLTVPLSHSFFANGFVSHNTTMLREVARVLADDLEKRVVVVDTSNEIAGDGDIPHPSIGRARRMQVPTPALQHAVMIEAVENHMPEVIVIDEIGTELEAAAARTIAERGVQLIGTAHGNTLENLMMNPTLSDLIGGIQSVTLSDEEARRRGTQKSILERKAPPTFTVMVEIRERDEVAVVRDVAGTVDAILRGQAQRAELRQRTPDGDIVYSEASPVETERVEQRPSRRGDGRVAARAAEVVEPEPEAMQRNPLAKGRGTPAKPVRIFPFGVSRNRLEQAISALAIPAQIVRDVREADMALTLKNYYRQRPQQLREAEARGVAIYVLRANTVIQMVNVLRDLVREARPEDLPEGESLSPSAPGDPVENAMFEAEEAINSVLDGAPPIELRPQAPYIRRLQHQLADRYNLGSRSRGREPHRHVEIFRQGSFD